MNREETIIQGVSGERGWVRRGDAEQGDKAARRATPRTYRSAYARTSSPTAFLRPTMISSTLAATP